MKEDDLKKKYKDEIKELTDANKKIIEDFNKFKVDLEKFIENVTKIEGELPHLNQEDFKFRMIELYGLSKGCYKYFIDLYDMLFVNIQRLNILEFNVQVIFDTVKDFEGFTDVKKEIEKKLKQYDKDKAFIDQLKYYVTKQIEKQEGVKNAPEVG